MLTIIYVYFLNVYKKVQIDFGAEIIDWTGPYNNKCQNCVMFKENNLAARSGFLFKRQK